MFGAPPDDGIDIVRQLKEFGSPIVDFLGDEGRLVTRPCQLSPQLVSPSMR